MRCNSGHTHDKSISNPLDDPFSQEQKEPHYDEPDYDLPTESIPPSPRPSRSEAPHGDESTAQPKYRMRRPAPPSAEEERKIKPFSKKPITFMFHATYGNQLYSIMEHGLKPGKSQSNPSGTMHVDRACIDDVILEDDESKTALTHVPAGRDALLILAFLKDQDYGIRLSEERTALTEQTIEARNIVAAFEPDGTLMASNKWIMKKHLDYEDFEMYDTKIREFADAFFKHVNSTKHNKEKDTSSETKKRRHSTDQDSTEGEMMEPSGERSVKPKVIVEYHNSENLEEFIQELKGIYLEIDKNKKDAEEELAGIKEELKRFMNQFNKDPKGAHPNLTEFMRNHPTKAIFDYQVSSAERYKHVNNEMFMNGSQDSDSHSPLMVYIRSKSATSKRNSERYQDYVKKRQSSWTTQEYKDYNKQWGYQKQWKDYSTSTWNDYGDHGSQSDSSRRWYRRSD